MKFSVRVNNDLSVAELWISGRPREAMATLAALPAEPASVLSQNGHSFADHPGSPGSNRSSLLQ